jgi:acetyltransferase-like isoleucine patch superfamily enzyme
MALINPGVTIGQNSVIGAGSVVNRSIPANVVAAGVPYASGNHIRRYRAIYHTARAYD